MFFAYQSHAHALVYLVPVFTALRNSNKFSSENLINLLRIFSQCLCVMLYGSNIELFYLFIYLLQFCNESLTLVPQTANPHTANNSRHRRKKGKKLRGRISERSVMAVIKNVNEDSLSCINIYYVMNICCRGVFRTQSNIYDGFLLLKGRFQNLLICSCSYKNNTLKISHS